MKSLQAVHGHATRGWRAAWLAGLSDNTPSSYLSACMRIAQDVRTARGRSASGASKAVHTKNDAGRSGAGNHRPWWRPPGHEGDEACKRDGEVVGGMNGRGPHRVVERRTQKPHHRRVGAPEGRLRRRTATQRRPERQRTRDQEKPRQEHRNERGRGTYDPVELGPTTAPR